MAVSKKEQAIRAYKKENKPAPKWPRRSAEYLARLATLRYTEMDKLLATQPIASIMRMQELGIQPLYNTAGTMYKDVAPVLSAMGIMYNAITKERKVISRHVHQVDAFIASQLHKRVTHTQQADGTRQPSQSAQGKVLSAQFQGISIKVACGMLHQAYREALEANPTDWLGLHKQLDWEIELLRSEQDRIAKLPR